MPAIPEMSCFFKTDSTTMQATLYLFMLTVALGQLLVGPLADRFGRRRIALSMALLFFYGILALFVGAFSTDIDFCTYHSGSWGLWYLFTVLYYRSR
ncbi:MFS transporter [Legionella pneumophila serogroup 2]